MMSDNFIATSVEAKKTQNRKNNVRTIKIHDFISAF
jgi:hypothetical protein